MIDYRKEAIEMLKEIKNEKMLQLVYGFVKAGYKEDLLDRRCIVQVKHRREK